MSHIKKKYGPWAVITGASDGIGKAFAEELAARQMNVVLVARRKPQLDSLAQELIAQHGVESLVIEADLSTPDGNQELINQTASMNIGLLVAAAGFGTSGIYLDGDIANELNMIDVNCRSSAQVAHAFGNRFKQRGRGGIVLMSSIVAFQGVPRAANYAATKAYIQSLAEGLRVELKPYHIDVIASAPGPVSSGFAKRANMEMGKAESPETVAKQTLRALAKRGTVRPGLMSKFLGYNLAMLPRWGRIKIMTLVMRGMTQ